MAGDGSPGAVGVSSRRGGSLIGTLPTQCGLRRLNVRPTGSIDSEPHVTYAPPVSWQVDKLIQTVKVINEQVRDCVRLSEPHIHGNSSPSLLVESQPSPTEHTAAVRAKVNLERGILP